MIGIHSPFLQQPHKPTFHQKKCSQKTFHSGSDETSLSTFLDARGIVEVYIDDFIGLTINLNNTNKATRLK